MSITQPMAMAKVRYLEFDGNDELSVTFKTESVLEMVQWLGTAINHYQKQLKFDSEFAYVKSYCIDYRIENTRMSMVIDRREIHEYVGHTY